MLRQKEKLSEASPKMIHQNAQLRLDWREQMFISL